MVLYMILVNSVGLKIMCVCVHVRVSACVHVCRHVWYCSY
jgi:hypothetical protein